VIVIVPIALCLCFRLFPFIFLVLVQAVCTEAGMFALRERRVHVTQEDFEMAVAKVMKKDTEKNMSLRKLWK
jgi:SpoVK/Ycf46/Vps4 family AAA+-type ATPase